MNRQWQLEREWNRELDEYLHNIYFPSDIMRMTKLKKMGTSREYLAFI
jgi:hypothetical protein